MAYIYILTLIVSLAYGQGLPGSRNILRAAIVGYKNQTHIEDYRAAAASLQHDKYRYCSVQLYSMEFDTTNGNTVYNSLNEARTSFSNDDYTVVIGPYIDVFTSHAYVIQEQVHLLTSEAGSDSSDRALPVLPSPESMSEAIAKIVEKLGWKKVSFLSQDDFAPVSRLTQLGITVIPIRLPSVIGSKKDRGLVQTLTNLRSSHVENIILNSMEKDVVNYTLSAAKSLTLLHHSIKWFITYLDFENVIANVTEMSTIFGLQLLDPNKLPNKVGIMGDKSRLMQGMTVDVVSLLHSLLHQTENCSVEPITDSIMSPLLFSESIQNQANPYVGALGQYVWIKRPEGSKGKLRTNYSMKIVRYSPTANKNGEKTVMFGNCSFIGDSPVITTTDDSDTNGERAVDFSQVLANSNFIVMTKVEAPFVIKRDNKYEGFCYDILTELQKRMGFKFEIREVPSATGYRDSNSWDDVILQLIVGNASIAIGSLAVTSKREELISFSYTIQSTSVSMLSKNPPASSTIFQFMWPFLWDLWVMIGAFFFIVGVALWLMSRYDVTQHGSEQRFDLKESMWYSLNVLLQGGTDYSPQTTSMRTIVAFFWFCTLIIISAYTANLAAFLTLQQIDVRIKTLDKLSLQADVKYGILNNSNIMNFFQNATIDPYERMWAMMKLNEKDSLLPNRQKALERVKAGKGDGGSSDFVFIDEAVINEYYALQECDMESMEQNFGQTEYSMGFPKGAPYKDDINRALLKMKEDGYLDDIRKKWWSPGKKCLSKGKEKKKQPTGVLDIGNMLGVFYVLIGSVVLALLVEMASRVYQGIWGKKDTKDKTETREKEEKLPLDWKPVGAGF